ncbi:hypothetical protein GH714_025633 [Hevea brasiliensis]|uniref:DDE Tnp4 domain-containing protein n=1 Tax=Hevea brasiliensis TaxID=3981 RepID=A0A6A6NJ68_HEVBR|nr:hypothetical protein GH714_025633 [Hevea brasiliensis]
MILWKNDVVLRFPKRTVLPSERDKAIAIFETDVHSVSSTTTLAYAYPLFSFAFSFKIISGKICLIFLFRPPSGLINIEGRLLSVEKQVAIALRRLASGESQVSVGAAFGVGQSTVSQVTWRFIEALEERAKHHLKWPDSSRMEDIKSKFEELFGLQNCCWPGGMTVSRLLKCSGIFKLYSVSTFNTIHEAARSLAVKSFLQLKGSWRILNKVMWRPDKRKLPSIILVCCLLHNIIIDNGDQLHPDVALSGHHDSGYGEEFSKQVDPLEEP